MATNVPGGVPAGTRQESTRYLSGSTRARAVNLLNAGALRIERYGLSKRYWYALDSEDPFAAPCCAQGALWLSAGFCPYRRSRSRKGASIAAIREARDLLAKYLIDSKLVPASWASKDPSFRFFVITTWNDAAERTAADVIAALRQAARAVS